MEGENEGHAGTSTIARALARRASSLTSERLKAKLHIKEA